MIKSLHFTERGPVEKWGCGKQVAVAKADRGDVWAKAFCFLETTQLIVIGLEVWSNLRIIEYRKQIAGRPEWLDHLG